MSVLKRTVLAWLLMLAIPLQGIAATAMLFCAPGHHGAVVAVAEAQDHSAHHHGTSHPASHTADAKCSACAACCTGTALVSAGLSEPAAMAGSAPIPFTLAPFASHIPLGADPPPRARVG